PIVYLGQERPGVLTYTDAGYLNPYGYTDDPAADILRTLLRSDAPAEVDAAAITARTVAGLLEPFASEEMLTERVLDVSRNRTAEGAPVYNPEDPEAWLDISGHLWGAVEPSLLTDARRVLRGVEARGEGGVGSEDAQPGRDAAAMLTGARVSTLDVRRAVRYRLYDARERLGLAEDALRAAIRAPGTADEAAIRGAYAELETARREVIQEGQRVTAAARTLGVPEKDVAEIADLALSGVTSADRRALLGGPYAPRLFRPTWGQRGVDALNLEGRGVSAAEVARRLAILRSFAGTASADSTAAPDE
ncbi:MAG TPA: hypothetical protein VK610_06645, partial [Rhodothermales bacterium]|nr:hypothetical protein [Rhodothermales bacterium]